MDHDPKAPILVSNPAEAANFPDLKALLLAMPDVCEDEDFERLSDWPREIEF